MAGMRSALATIAAMVFIGTATARGAFKPLDDAGWVISWPDSQQTAITLENVSADKQTVTINVSATLDAGDIHWAGFLNPLVLTFQQTKPDAAASVILHSLIENQTGYAWDTVSFKLLGNQSVNFDTPHTAGIAPYNSVLLESGSRVLSFTDGQLDDAHTFTTSTQGTQLLVAAHPTSNLQGDFSLKIAPDLVAAHVPEPGSAAIFALGGLLVLVDRRPRHV